MSTVLIAAAAGFVGFLFGMFTVALCVVAAKADEPMSPEDRARVRERLLEISGSPQARSHWVEDYDLEQWAELHGPAARRMN